jgi:hypothetical protein
MPKLPRGLYESLITEELERQLAELGAGFALDRQPLREAEAADRLAWQLQRLTQRALERLGAKERVKRGVALIREIAQLGSIGGQTPNGTDLSAWS